MGRSISMPTAGWTRRRLLSGCSKAKRARPRRASTSAATVRTAMCASPIRGAWRTSRRPPRASNGLRLPGLLPERLEPRLLGEHLVRVGRGRLVEGARVHLQRRLRVSQPALVLAQDLRADHDVDGRVEQRLLAAVVGKLLEVLLRHHLHQAFGAHGALRDRIEARLHGDDREYEKRVDTLLAPGSVSRVDEGAYGLLGDAVALRDVLDDGTLLALGRLVAAARLDGSRGRGAAGERIAE